MKPAAAARALLLSCCTLASAAVPSASRRTALRAGAALLLPPPPRAARAMSAEELDALDEASRSDPGTLLPSGVRVLELVEGTGRRPAEGERV
eukprot:2596819-Prymnesium_polylepis.1